MADKLPITTDQKFESPATFQAISSKFWKKEITNDDCLDMYRRKGLVNKTGNKQVSLMFKRGFTLDDESAYNAYYDSGFDQALRYAYLNSWVSGFCLIYVQYDDSGEYMDEVSANARPLSYAVVPKAWIHEDRYYNKEVRNFYKIYKADGTEFSVHESRFIRVSYNPEEISAIETAYDALQVLDNTIWSIGQSIYRNGSGFPVLTIDKPDKIVTKNGSTEKTTKIQAYKSTGLLRDLNNQVGFMLEKGDELSFVGANGKALDPKPFYDAAIQQVAIELDVPVDVLKGVAAGAVTGSETNLKTFYGDLHAKQIEQLEPYIRKFLELNGFDSRIEINWQPIFEQTPEEKANSLEKDAKLIHQLELNNYYTHDQAVEYLATKYPELNYDEAQIAQAKALETNRLQSSQFSFNQGQSTDAHTCSHTDDESALPKSVQKIESKFDKEMNQAFKQSQKNITKLFQAFERS